jgi:hypothetical protein
MMSAFTKSVVGVSSRLARTLSPSTTPRLVIGLAVLGALGFSQQASAAHFTVVIRNDTTVATQAGLLTLTPLIPTSTAGTALSTMTSSTSWRTYGYISDDCDLNGTTDDDGDPVALAAAWGLTIGTNAWVVPAMPKATTGQVSNVVVDIDVSDTTAKLYFLAATATQDTGTTPKDADDFVTGVDTSGTLDAVGISLFSSGYPINAVEMNLSAWDANSKSATNGNTDPNNNNGNGNNLSHRCSSSGATVNACGTTWKKNNNFTNLPCYVAVKNSSFTTGKGPTQAAAAKFVLNVQNNGSLLTGGAGDYRPDGLSLANFSTATAREEIAVIEEDGDATFTTASQGRFRVISRDGAEISGTSAPFQPPAGRDLEGIPLAVDLDNNGTYEAVFGESYNVGYVYARTGTGLSAFPGWSGGKVGPYGYPALFNMGPTSADLGYTDTKPEIVITDWNGVVSIRKASDGTQVGNGNVYTDTSIKEGFDSTVAIADVLTQTECNALVSGADCSGNEIIGFGNRVGHVFVLDRTGKRVWVSSTAPGASSASSPAVGDVDGDGRNDIVVLPEGTNTAIAFSPSQGSGLRYSWSLPGEDYYWTSPTIASVLPKTSTTDLRKEILVESSNAELSVLQVSSAGVASVAFSTFVGLGDMHATCDPTGSTVCEDAWFTPSPADVISEGSASITVGGTTGTRDTLLPAYEIVAAQLSSLEVIDPTPNSTVSINTVTNSFTYKLTVTATNPAISIQVSFASDSTATAAEIAAGLAAAINSNTTLYPRVTALPTGGTIVVNADNGGDLFTVADTSTTVKTSVTAGWTPRVTYRYSASDAQFYPTALVRSRNTTGGTCTSGTTGCARIYVSGWENGYIYGLDIMPTVTTTLASPIVPKIPKYDWSTYMGSAAHTGTAQ